jgi:hypothetical protein
MEPHGRSPWYLSDIPSYAKASEDYPPIGEIRRSVDYSFR